MTPPTIIGVDLSLTSTGLALPDGKLEVIQPKQKGAVRLFAIRREVNDFIARYENPVIVVEGYSFAARHSQAHSIGELGGVMKLSWYENDWQVIIVPPTNRAKFATGKGNANKSEVVSAISARTGMTFSGKGADDQCDAWILQEMGMVAYGQSDRTWPKVNLSALEAVDWGIEIDNTGQDDDQP